MAKLAPTPSQTLGPFFSYGLLREDDHVIAGPEARGERVRLEGVLRDSAGDPVRDALIEVWQADAAGRYPGRDGDADPAVKGFGRTLTDADGRFRFETVLPGASAGLGNSAQAPHFALGLFSGGLTRRVMTRVYVPDTPEMDRDETFATIPKAARATLVGTLATAADGSRSLECAIALGGDAPTAVFRD